MRSRTRERSQSWVVPCASGPRNKRKHVLVEIVAGIAGGSKALQALTLDFLGDAANDAINLSVTGMVLAWRGRAAVLEGATLGFSERTFSPQ